MVGFSVGTGVAVGSGAIVSAAPGVWVSWDIVNPPQCKCTAISRDCLAVQCFVLFRKCESFTMHVPIFFRSFHVLFFKAFYHMAAVGKTGFLGNIV